MCGICGYVHFDRSKRASERIVREMASTLVHRGPDDEGFLIKDNVGLGHRRLSIIDLATGHQPMTSDDGSVAAVYNGEIYNFRELKQELIAKGRPFRTHSDTEVLIRAYEEYGDGCLDMFEGMFAFALWDARKERLFLARDRFGKKPLYYAVFDNQFIFGSELKAVLKHPSARREIDFGAVSKYLAYEYVPSPYSIFKGIRKLEAASSIAVAGGKVSESKRYWDMRFAPQASLDIREMKSRLVTLLKESVRKRLVSDVPLGVFLSGGIDSSAVVAMMSRLIDPKDIKTFSIGFREKAYDESSDARAVARFFGTDHYEEIVEPRTMLEALPAVLDVLDEPFADASVLPTYLVSRFTRKHVTVALGGDGGDELFFGYPSFMAHKIDNYLKGVPPSLKTWCLNVLTKVCPISHNYMSLQFKARRFIRGFSYPDAVRHQVWIGSFIPSEQAKLLKEELGLDLSAETVYGRTVKFNDQLSGVTALEKASYIYLNTYMTDDILAKVDRASMACSLEVRAPFLDKEFAGYALTIPGVYKMRGFTTKWILKEALRDILPPDTIRKKKHGFAVPVTKWLRGELKGLLLSSFEKAKIERQGIFSYAYIDDLLRQYLGGNEALGREVWNLFVFEQWFDRWMK